MKSWVGCFGSFFPSTSNYITTIIEKYGSCTSSSIQNRLWEQLIPYNPFTALPSVENKSLGGGWLLGAWQLQRWPCPQKREAGPAEAWLLLSGPVDRKGTYGKRRPLPARGWVVRAHTRPSPSHSSAPAQAPWPPEEKTRSMKSPLRNPASTKDRWTQQGFLSPFVFLEGRREEQKEGVR